MAEKSDLGAREMESYVDTGKSKSIEITLSTAGTVTTLTLPSDAKGFRVYSSTDRIRFSVNNTVEVKATSVLTTIPASALAVGGIVLPGYWETRLLPSIVKTKSTDPQRTISFSSALDNSVFDLETF